MEMNLPIEEKYKQGPGTMPDISQASIPEQQPMTKEQAMEFLDDKLPIMRLQGEYDRLMIEQLTNDVLLARRPINEVPGLLGLELKIREIKALGWLGEYQIGLQNAQDAEREKVEALKAAEKTI